MSRKEHPDYTIVTGSLSGLPVLLLSNGRVAYLRDWDGHHDRGAGTITKISAGAMRRNALFTGKLTDEEEVLAMRLILEHG